MAALLAAALREAHAQVINDLKVLDKLLYRNRNQHRRAVFFRRLTQVRRLHLTNNFLEMAASLDKYKPKQDWAPLQSRLRCIASTIALNLVCIGKCSRELAHLVKQTFFLPISLTCLGLLARFFVIQKSVLMQVCELIEQKNLTADTQNWLGVAEDQEASLTLMIECHRLLAAGIELPWLDDILGKQVCLNS